MKHLLILISILLLSSPLFGDKETHPVYKGQVEDGEFHGQGTLTYTDGRKYVGKFKDDEKWNGTGYDKKETSYTGG